VGSGSLPGLGPVHVDPDWLAAGAGERDGVAGKIGEVAGSLDGLGHGGLSKISLNAWMIHLATDCNRRGRSAILR